MAWYTLEYHCGHEGKKQLYGKVSSRESYVKWAREQTCPDCIKAARAAEIQKENEAAAELAATMNLPALTGTEKQITWATTIRANCLDGYDKKIAELSNNDSEAAKIVLRGYQICRARIAQDTSSKSWIDRRDSITRQPLKGATERKVVAEVILAGGLNEKITDEQYFTMLQASIKSGGNRVAIAEAYEFGI